MATSADPQTRRSTSRREPVLTVYTATRLEAWAARRDLPRQVSVVRVGVGGAGASFAVAAPFVSCGLAGALSAALPPGTVVVPAWVGLPSGERLVCHPPLVEALLAAARALGHEAVTAPLVTTLALVAGSERQHWAAQGYAAVDMESGPLLRRQPRGAVVRVVLDSPVQELSPHWERPLRVVVRPWLWPEAARLALAAPRYARLAAAVVAAGLADLVV